MNLSALDYALWLASFLGDAALLAVLLCRRRSREFPVFTILMGFETLLSPLLYAIYRYGSANWYVRVYWASDLIDFILQLGIVFEIVRIVLRPTGSWVRDARKQFIIWGAAGILMAVALPWLITPPADTLLDRLVVRAELFSSLLICELIAAVTRTSKNLGLGWRNHVMALGNGWTAWAVAAILVDGLHGYFGAQRYFSALEHARMLVFIAVLGYWIVQFWLEEPARQPIPPQFQAYLQALHQRVKNDLDTLEERG
jgi:hypothetical protein